MLDPLAVAPDMPMTRTWEGGVRKLETRVNFTCSAGLTTANGSQVQQQVCTLAGWVSHAERRQTSAERMGETR